MATFKGTVITARKRSLRRLCFHRCLSTGGLSAFGPGGGGCLPHTLWADTPLGRHPPAQCMLGYTPLAQCMLGYGQQAGGKHTHSCDWQCNCSPGLTLASHHHKRTSNCWPSVCTRQTTFFTLWPNMKKTNWIFQVMSILLPSILQLPLFYNATKSR